MSTFKDHFSGHAADYARYRPTYPAELFAWLAEQAPGREHAWDAGTGNGQVAVALTAWFDRVTATDASAEQVASATPHPRVTYGVAPAEASGVPDGSADLVTVAQALHWFDIPAFFAEARRALRPGGVVAVWRYALMTTDPAVDAEIAWFYTDVVGPYWPAERRLVEQGYDDLDFPFTPVPSPPFAMRAEWDLPGLLGYLGTWSAAKRFQAANGTNPLELAHDRLAAAWGAPERVRTISFPLGLRVGRRPA